MYPCGAPDYSVSSAIPLKLSCFFSQSHIRSLARLCKDFLIPAYAFVTSRQDCYDALYACITQSSLNHLQFD